MNASPAWYLRLFGSPSIEDPDGSNVSGRAAQRHRLALLALLALTPARRLTRDKLIAYLWPESDPEHARNLLNVALYTLRKALGESTLISGSDDVRLAAAAVRTDVADFDAAIAAQDHAAALALYRGDLLDGFFINDAPEFERWAERERRRLASAYDRALEALAESAESANDLSGAAERWKARAVRDPYDSRVALRLMQALEAGGNPAAALQHAAVHERLLRSEYGVGPAPSITAMAQRLRSQSPPEDVPDRTPGALPHDRDAVPDENSPDVAADTISGDASIIGGRRVPPDASRYETGAAIIVDGRVVSPALDSDATSGAANVASRAVSPDATANSPRRSSTRRIGWPTAVALLVLAFASAAWMFWPSAPHPEGSIAVLPFVNLSADAANEYFTDGVTDEIITRLASIPELKVISRTSTTHYKGSRKSLREIAHELDVTHVLEGSVRLSDSTVRISAQLVDARTDAHVWTSTYEDARSSAYALQMSIARDVAQALEVELGEQTRRLLVRQGTDDPDAYEFYRRGRLLWSLRTRDGHVQAVAYFERAIAHDSNYADAYAGLADAYLTAWQLNLADRSEEEAYALVRQAAARAVALDDESADAHVSFAVARWWQRDWPGAERELRRAITLNPGHATAHGWYSLLLRGMGRASEAREEARRASELDPFAVIVGSTLAWQCQMDGDDACAIEQFRRTIDVGTYSGAWIGLAISYARTARFDEAFRAADMAVKTAPERSELLADVAYIQALAGDNSAARATLRRAKEQPREAFSIARAHVALGEADSAFAWLERASWKWPHRASLGEPGLDRIRSDARFGRLKARIEKEMGTKIRRD